LTKIINTQFRIHKLFRQKNIKKKTKTETHIKLELPLKDVENKRLSSILAEYREETKLNL